MKIGYPCINRSVDCTSSSTFRLASYSQERLEATVQSNLNCLERILDYNVENGLLFFRISSDIIPFASHPCCDFDWKSCFSAQLLGLGRKIADADIRISMHPDQFVVINSLKPVVVQRSIEELEYHCIFLDSMQLPQSAKIQIHLGGVYGDKDSALRRFIEVSATLSPNLRRRLVIENDERLYGIEDCLFVHRETGFPVLFDNFHHQCYGSDRQLEESLLGAAATWGAGDGVPMMDYSSQLRDGRVGSHATSIEIEKFATFVTSVVAAGLDPDIMLEIKDKEASALKAVQWMRENNLL